jgi:hypothetical protein
MKRAVGSFGILGKGVGRAKLGAFLGLGTEHGAIEIGSGAFSSVFGDAVELGFLHLFFDIAWEFGFCPGVPRWVEGRFWGL